MAISDQLKPLWHVGQGKALFAGPLNRNALHAHSVPVLLAGLYGPFSLRVGAAGAWMRCRTAAIPAGVPYEFDMSGEPLGVLYLEPELAGVDALGALLRDAEEVNGALVGGNGEVSLLRELYECASGASGVDPALSDLLAFARRRARSELDPRISRIVATLAKSPGENAPVAEHAASVGLSAWHFQHLFTRQVGVPFRRYRNWQRLRAAIAEIVQGSNFTEAAHMAGFCDQAHFAREFRRTFGAPASPSLKKLRPQGR